MSRFGVEGSLELLNNKEKVFKKKSLELLVSDIGVDGAISSVLNACQLNGNFTYKLIKDTGLKTTFTQS